MAFRVTKHSVRTCMMCCAIIALCYCSGVLTDDNNIDVKVDAGHLMKFGDGRPVLFVDEIDGFPSSDEFLSKYVVAKRPLKMKNAARFSTATKLWTDDYFLKIDIPEYETVEVESGKKENRKAKIHNWHFHDFIRKYNHSQVYMVEDLPYYLAHDVMMPCPLQCDNIEEYLIQTIMWMNSGGTSSVIHTDQWNNFNCLFRGDKEFRLIDSRKYNPDVIIDVKKKGYSSADVDRVDFVRFPGLATVAEYYHVNISAGDCLYLPVNWVHQVRSYGSNVAVNLWFRPERVYDLGKCNSKCDITRTMADYDFTSPEVVLQSPEKFKEHFSKMIYKKGGQSKEQLIRNALGSEFDDAEVMEELLKFEDQIFTIMDHNKDGILDIRDLTETKWKSWVHAHELFKSMAILENASDDYMTLDGDVIENEDEVSYDNSLSGGGDSAIDDELQDGRDEL